MRHFAAILLFTAVFASAQNTSLNELRTRAQAGDAEAQGQLGRMYVNGTGVTRDIAEAVKLCRASAAKNNAIGQACFGFMLAAGIGVPQDFDEAFRFISASAAQNNSRGIYWLGRLYDTSTGYKNNDAEAAKWYRIAAEQGDSEAQFQFGVMLSGARGVPRDDAGAVRWYRLSAAQNYAPGQLALANAFFSGLGVAKDPAEAVKLYRAAANSGLSNAQNNLGALLSDGNGAPKDEAEAVRYFRLAADQQNPQGIFNLGLMTANGRGVPKNEAEGVRLFKVAAEKGSSEAQLEMGRRYENGLGVEKNLDQASFYYQAAAKQGVGAAKTAAASVSEALAKEKAANQKREREQQINVAVNNILARCQQRYGLLVDTGALGKWRTYSAELKSQMEPCTHVGHAASDRLYGLAIIHESKTVAEASRGVDLLEKAALAGDLASQMIMGDLRAENSWYGERNYDEAAAWYTLAAEKDRWALRLRQNIERRKLIERTAGNLGKLRFLLRETKNLNPTSAEVAQLEAKAKELEAASEDALAKQIADETFIGNERKTPNLSKNWETIRTREAPGIVRFEIPPCKIDPFDAYLSAHPGAILVTKGITPPKKTGELGVQYTELTRKAKLEGDIRFRLVVDGQGKVQSPLLLCGLGMGLDQPALELLRKYTFIPATKDGQPVRVVVDMTVPMRVR